MFTFGITINTIIINTIITVFPICSAKYFKGLKTDWACEVGTMTMDTIPDADRKNSYYYIYFPDMLQTYQRETKLIEFTRDRNTKQSKIRKKMLLCNNFTLKWHDVTFLDYEIYREISARRQGLLSQ